MEVIELTNQENIRTQGEKEKYKYQGIFEADTIKQKEMYIYEWWRKPVNPIKKKINCLKKYWFKKKTNFINDESDVFNWCIIYWCIIYGFIIIIHHHYYYHYYYYYYYYYYLLIRVFTSA